MWVKIIIGIQFYLALEMRIWMEVGVVELGPLKLGQIRMGGGGGGGSPLHLAK